MAQFRVKSILSLRELLALKGKTIKIGKDECIKFSFLGKERSIQVKPGYLFINDENEIWYEEDCYFTIDKQGIVHFFNGHDKNSWDCPARRDLANAGIEEIIITGNLIWVKRKNKGYEKVVYFAPLERALYNARTFERIDFIKVIDE